MYVPLNCVIIDSDAANRQELATFLGRFGVHVVGRFASVPKPTPLEPLNGEVGDVCACGVPFDPSVYQSRLDIVRPVSVCILPWFKLDAVSSHS